MPIKLPEWKEYTDKTVAETHGNVKLYRDLYYGNHGAIFERAKELIKNGELVDNIENGMTKNPKGNVRTPYLIANACKIICKVPATMVSRAVGSMSLQEDQEFTDPQASKDLNTVDPTKADGQGVIYLSDILEDIERASGF
jgi:hypothetical protein